MPTFSVIMPTRNRAALFHQALRSVLAQQGASMEVIVVNDGTSGAEAEALAAIKAEHEAVTFIDLPVTTGHGCFRVMNTGAERASGDYLCFLDDDDVWTDPGHLADAASVLAADPAAIDVLYFDQEAYRGQMRAPGPIWLEDLGARLRLGPAGPGGAYAVTVPTLLTAHGFAHTNTTIVRRSTFGAVGGFDTTLWYEGDRDFYLRLVDRAGEIRYRPRPCGRHNIPDHAKRSSMTTTTSNLDKALDQVRLLHKAARLSRHAELRAYARTHRRFALRRALDAALRHPRLLVRFLRFLPILARAPAPTSGVVTVTLHG